MTTTTHPDDLREIEERIRRYPETDRDGLIAYYDAMRRGKALAASNTAPSIAVAPHGAKPTLKWCTHRGWISVDEPDQIPITQPHDPEALAEQIATTRANVEMVQAEQTAKREAENAEKDRLPRLERELQELRAMFASKATP